MNVSRLQNLNSRNITASDGQQELQEKKPQSRKNSEVKKKAEDTLPHVSISCLKCLSHDFINVLIKVPLEHIVVDKCLVAFPFDHAYVITGQVPSEAENS